MDFMEMAKNSLFTIDFGYFEQIVAKPLLGTLEFGGLPKACLLPTYIWICKLQTLE